MTYKCPLETNKSRISWYPNGHYVFCHSSWIVRQLGVCTRSLFPRDLQGWFFWCMGRGVRPSRYWTLSERLIQSSHLFGLLPRRQIWQPRGGPNLLAWLNHEVWWGITMVIHQNYDISVWLTYYDISVWVICDFDNPCKLLDIIFHYDTWYFCVTWLIIVWLLNSVLAGIFFVCGSGCPWSACVSYWVKELRRLAEFYAELLCLFEMCSGWSVKAGFLACWSIGLNDSIGRWASPEGLPISSPLCLKDFNLSDRI